MKQYLLTLTGDAESLTAEEVHSLLCDEMFPDDYPPNDVVVTEVQSGELELLQAAVRDLFGFVTELDPEPIELPSAYISDLEAGLAANRAVEAGGAS